VKFGVFAARASGRDFLIFYERRVARFRAHNNKYLRIQKYLEEMRERRLDRSAQIKKSWFGRIPIPISPKKQSGTKK
jgi:hypothetical protein